MPFDFKKQRIVTDEEYQNFNQLTIQQIERIREVYKEESSIDRTAEITGHCRNTINKYVKDISVLKRNSRDYEGNEVLRICPNTGKIERRYKTQLQASKDNFISPDTLNKCIKGHTATAGGKVWVLESEYDQNKDYTVKSKFHFSDIAKLNRILFM